MQCLRAQLSKAPVSLNVKINEAEKQPNVITTDWDHFIGLSHLNFSGKVECTLEGLGNMYFT